MRDINYIALILTGKEKDDNLQKLVEDRMQDAGIEVRIRVDPLRVKSGLLTPKGMFQGEKGIKFYLDRFISPEFKKKVEK